SHPMLIAMAVVCVTAGYLIIRQYLLQAIILNVSAYLYLAAANQEGLLAISVLVRMALGAAFLSCALGIAIYASGAHARFAVGNNKPKHLVGYFLVLLPGSALAFAMGNKREVFGTLVAGILFYLGNALRPRRAIIIATGIAGVVLFGIIEVLRG